MDMFDEAHAILGTMNLCKITQSALARQLGVSQSYVANKLRLLDYSPELIQKIRGLGITERHARAILRLPKEEREGMIDEVATRRLSVRECEALIDRIVLRYLPKRVGRAEGLERISEVEGIIRESVEHLVAGGVDARARTSYHEGDMYITVYIKGA